jgi:hypothetical protein
MKLKWQQAPVKTQWGDEMVVASVSIDKDHTLDLYCEREQIPKVEAMLIPQFPTMLRKMWSGSEVQEWINENWSKR